MVLFQTFAYLEGMDRGIGLDIKGVKGNPTTGLDSYPLQMYL
jgi:hypothetical protein